MSFRNQWTIFCGQSPHPPHGVLAEFDDTGRIVVELAKLTEAEIADVDPVLAVWTDITCYVIDAEWVVGTTDTAESRWPVGQLIINTFSLEPESSLGHFRHPNQATRLNPGSLIRIGINYPDDEIWIPWFTGIIDRFDTDNVPGPETWRIAAYDVLYYASGWRLQEDTPVTTTAGITGAAALDEIWDTIEFPFETLTPTVVGITVDSFEIRDPVLSLVHRVADSCGGRVWANGGGQVVVGEWNDFGPGPTIPIIEATSQTAGQVFGVWRWSSVRQRVATWLRLSDAFGVESRMLVDDSLQARAGDREDAAGWPKLDLLFDGGSVFANALLTDAVSRHGYELGIDFVDVDTAQPQNGVYSDGAAFELLRDYTVPGRVLIYPTYDRGGALIYFMDVAMMGVRKRVTRVNELWRMTARYYPKVLEVVEVVPEPPPWTNPGDFTGLEAWYDASNAGSITASSGLVSQWSDLSPNALHLLASSTARPTTGTTTQNSLNVIAWTTANYMWHLTPSAWKFLHDGTDVLIGVVWNPGSSGTRSLLGQNTGAFVIGVNIFASATGSRVTASCNNGAVTPAGVYEALSSSSATFSAANLHTFLFDAENVTAASRAQIFKSGATNGASTSGTATPSSSNPSAAYMAVGARLNTANNTIETNMNGWIAEIVIVAGAEATEANRVLLRDYLNSKWNVY